MAAKTKSKGGNKSTVKEGYTRKSFDITDELNDMWLEWLPNGSRGASPEIAGALLLWMQIPADVQKIIKAQAKRRDLNAVMMDFWGPIWAHRARGAQAMQYLDVMEKEQRGTPPSPATLLRDTRPPDED